MLKRLTRVAAGYSVILCEFYVLVGKLTRYVVEEANPEFAANMKCGVSRDCGEDGFPVHIYSGYQNSEAPRMCIDGKRWNRITSNYSILVGQFAYLHINTFRTSRILLDGPIIVLQPIDYRMYNCIYTIWPQQIAIFGVL